MFRLLRYFSLTSLFAFVVVSALLGVFYRQIALHDLITLGESKNVALTQAFANSLWPQFAPFVESASSLSREALRAHPEITNLRHAVLALMRGLSVVKVKVYTLDGLTVFSTQASQIGDDKSTNAGFRAARMGKMASELTHRDTFSAFEEIIENRDVFSSYIPIRRGGPTGAIEGVFELYDDVTPLLQHIKRTQRRVVLGVLLLSAILYAILYCIVRRADRIMRHQHAALREARNELEQRVEERTADLQALNAQLQRQITERLQAEAALRQSEERFSKAFHASPDAIVITRLADGRYIDVNESFLCITGYCRNEVMGHTVIELSIWVDSEEWNRVVQTLREQGSVHDLETRCRTKPGELREARLSLERIDLDGEPCILTIIRDVTEHKRLERQLRQAQKLEAIGTLAGGIAHDFNNILSAILGYGELTQDDLPEGSLPRENLEQILKAGHRAKDLVQQILAFSRQQEQEYKPVQVAPIIEEVLKLLRASLPATIEIHHDLTAPCGTVLADPTQLHQVIMNLCTNAGHAMQAHGGTLEVRLTDVEVDPDFAAYKGVQAGTYVCMTVSDTGCGMPSEVLEHIFEPFFTTKAPGEGTGMGLAVVHGIVKSHGGGITIYSEPGNGTTFHVLLPSMAGSAMSDVAPAVPIPAGTERILFVDDEESLVFMGQQMLERLGYTVVGCTKSLEALEVFRAAPHRFDLVITDRTMPHLTGEALAHELRGIRSNIPIILCTGFSHVMHAEKARALGVNAFLIKPVSARDLGLAIRRVLAQEPALAT